MKATNETGKKHKHSKLIQQKNTENTQRQANSSRIIQNYGMNEQKMPKSE